MPPQLQEQKTDGLDVAVEDVGLAVDVEVGREQTKASSLNAYLDAAASTITGGGAAMRAKKAAREKVARRRMQWRACCLVFILGFYYSIWCLVTFRNQTWAYPTQSFDPALGVQLRVRACDVVLSDGSEARVTYEARASLFTIAWEYHANGLLRSAELSNSDKSCLAAPYRDCGRLCRVSVTVPSDASGTVVIEQPADDLSFPVIRVASGATIAALSLRSRAGAALPTASLEIERGATVSSLSAIVYDGDVRSTGGRINSINVRSTGSGGIYLLELPAPAADVPLTFRQPSSRLCYATDVDGPTVSFEAGAPWTANCEPDELIGGVGLTTSTFVAGYARAVFDKDSNGRVTKAEFEEGMGDLHCCGGNAPFSCWCEDEAYRVFPPRDDRYFDRFDLTFTEFMTQMIVQVGAPLPAQCARRVDRCSL